MSEELRIAIGADHAGFQYKLVSCQIDIVV
jgi:hypothetical protein